MNRIKLFFKAWLTRENMVKSLVYYAITLTFGLYVHSLIAMLVAFLLSVGIEAVRGMKSVECKFSWVNVVLALVGIVLAMMMMFLKF